MRRLFFWLPVTSFPFLWPRKPFLAHRIGLPDQSHTFLLVLGPHALRIQECRPKPQIMSTG